MQIVISVTDLQRKWIENYGFIPDDLNVKMADTILKGTALSKVIEDIRAEIEFERDRKLGGEAFEAVQYKAYQTALDIIDKHIKGDSE